MDRKDVLDAASLVALHLPPDFGRVLTATDLAAEERVHFDAEHDCHRASGDDVARLTRGPGDAIPAVPVHLAVVLVVDVGLELGGCVELKIDVRHVVTAVSVIAELA